MAYDLVIRNGTVIDGSGFARFRADVGIRGDRIARIGRIDEKGAVEIDAEGHVVSPGFIDGHTHMDAQIFWDMLGTSSCWHGVTSVVMGNCGFTLAPSRPGEHGLVMDNLERAEDIPAASMVEGIDWNWESFPEYLDSVERQPKAINYAAQIGHSALRTFAMGERAFDEPASEADLAVMVRTLQEALRAGAFGFSTSVSNHHSTPSGRPVASRVGTWAELSTLVDVIGHEGAGLFQYALDTALTESDDVEVARSFYDRLRALAVATRVPVTYGLRHEHMATQLETFDATAAAGGKMFGQCRSNSSSRIYCFKSRMPFDSLPEWKVFRTASLEEQRARLRDPLVRAELVDSVNAAYGIAGRSGETGTPPPKMPPFEQLKLMQEGKADESIAALARGRGVAPIDLIIDAALDSNFEQVFGLFNDPDEEPELIAAMKHPRTVMTFSDSGAHVSQHSGADLQTNLLAYWVRERGIFTLEEGIRMLTLSPAMAWQIPDRGLLSEGMIADVNVFDPEAVAPGVPALVNDLPAGVPRVRQKAVGIRSTIVAGKEVFRDSEHTGALPGRLIRSSLATNGSAS